MDSCYSVFSESQMKQVPLPVSRSQVIVKMDIPLQTQPLITRVGKHHKWLKRVIAICIVTAVLGWVLCRHKVHTDATSANTISGDDAEACKCLVCPSPSSSTECDNMSFDLDSTEMYIISLERDVVKFARATQEVKRHLPTLDALRFNAIDGKTTSARAFAQMRVVNKDNLAASGCAASHMSLWDHVGARTHKGPHDWIMIFEDDILLHEDFTCHLVNALQQIPADATMLFLGHCFSHFVSRTAGTDRKDKTKNPYWLAGAPLCTHAYMIKRHFAPVLSKALKPCMKPIDNAIHDWFRGRNWKGAYYLDPTRTTSTLKQKHTKQYEWDGIVFQDGRNISSIQRWK
jgi:GR25 family glycosyltransferase involved in LPS biosynthesis